MNQVEQAILAEVRIYGGRINIERLSQALYMQQVEANDFYSALDNLCESGVLAEFTKGVISLT